MARKPRLEVEGGLHHILTRGNNRRQIFGNDDDYQKMLSLLAVQKAKLRFFLYAYCLMPNHIHLLVERRKVAIGRVMHRLLTGYSRYYNKRYGRVGHLFQSRYKGILCQSDQYLAELVRYIHLNPVRAKIVRTPEAYPYSSHLAYIGLKEPGMVDVEPVLRHFGGTKKLARERFGLFVKAGIKGGHREEFYGAEEGRILGSEEFVDETKKRVGETPRGSRPEIKRRSTPNLEGLIEAAANASRLTQEEICSRSKRRRDSDRKGSNDIGGARTGSKQHGGCQADGGRQLASEQEVGLGQEQDERLKRTAEPCEADQEVDYRGGTQELKSESQIAGLAPSAGLGRPPAEATTS
jgi:REP-associated tyrosine transposase